MSPVSSNPISTCSDGARSFTSQLALSSSFMSTNIGFENSVRLTASFGTWACSMSVRGRLV